MMKHLTIHIAWCIIVVVVTLTSCDHHDEAHRTLDLAESLMEDRPDSALAIINELENTPYANTALEARRALLKSMALHKNFIDVDSDSLTAVALSYYGGRSNRFDMLANFQHAWVLYNKKDCGHAVIPALQSLQLAGQQRDTLYMARTNSLLGKIYENSYNSEMSEGFYETSMKLYDILGKETNKLYENMDLALSLTYQGYSDDGIAMMDSIIAKALQSSDTIMYYNGLRYLIHLCAMANRWEETVDAYEKMVNISEESSIPCPIKAKAAEAYLCTGNVDKCRELVAECHSINDKSDEVSLWLTERALSRYVGDYARSENLSDSLLAYQSKEILRLLKQSTIKAQRDKYMEDSIRATNDAKIAQTNLLIVIFIVTLLIIVSYIVIRQFLTNQKIKIEKYVDNVSQLTDNIEKIQCELNENSEEMLSLKAQYDRALIENSKQKIIYKEFFADNFSYINNLCDEFFGKNNEKTECMIIYKKLESEIEKISKYFDTEDCINNFNGIYDNIITKLRCDIRDLSDIDIKIIMLCLLGFTSKSICLLTNQKISTYYYRRSSLSKKIDDSNLPYAKKLLYRLGKR